MLFLKKQFLKENVTENCAKQEILGTCVDTNLILLPPRLFYSSATLLPAAALEQEDIKGGKLEGSYFGWVLCEERVKNADLLKGAQGDP